MKHVLITGMTPNHGGVESFIYNYVSKLQGPIKFDFIAVTLGAYQKELEALGCHVYFGARYGKSPQKARVLTCKIFFEECMEIRRSLA